MDKLDTYTPPRFPDTTESIRNPARIPNIMKGLYDLGRHRPDLHLFTIIATVIDQTRSAYNDEQIYHATQQLLNSKSTLVQNDWENLPVKSEHSNVRTYELPRSFVEYERTDFQFRVAVVSMWRYWLDHSMNSLYQITRKLVSEVCADPGVRLPNILPDMAVSAAASNGLIWSGVRTANPSWQTREVSAKITTDVTEIVEFAFDPAWEVVHAVHLKEGCPPEAALRWMQQKDRIWRVMAASCPYSPAVVFETLAFDGEKGVRDAVANNSACPSRLRVVATV